MRRLSKRSILVFLVFCIRYLGERAMRGSCLGVVAMVISCLAAGKSFAADLPEAPPAPIPYAAMSWTGFYAGAFAGYHDSHLTQEGCMGLCPTSSDGPSGALLGIQGGFDYQFANNIVLGAYGWIPLLRPEKTIHLGFGADFKVSPQFAAIGGIRAGYAIDRFLPYLTGGVAYANVDTRSFVTGATPSNDHWGYMIGIGAEYAITDHWSVDAKYMFTSLGKKEYDFGGGFEKYGENSNNFVAAVNYRF